MRAWLLVVGIIAGERIWTELQPDFRDNNLQLTGTFAAGWLQGEWVWTGLQGIIGRGRYAAVRQ